MNLVLNNDKANQPKRSTIGSAGYDVFADCELLIQAKSFASYALPFTFSGLDKTEYSVRLYLRSSMGIKKKLRLYSNGNRVNYQFFDVTLKANTITLYNDSDQDVLIQKDEHFVQMIIGKPADKSVSFEIENVVEEELAKHTIVKGRQVADHNDLLYTLDEDMVFAPGEQKLIVTGLKGKIPAGTWLGIYIENGPLYFANGTPIIDSDYYNNPANDGNCMLALVNPTKQELLIPKGEVKLRWKCEPYYKLSDEILTAMRRVSGIGST
jgi:dUTP pyrophosphatase